MKNLIFISGLLPKDVFTIFWNKLDIHFHSYSHLRGHIKGKNKRGHGTHKMVGHRMIGYRLMVGHIMEGDTLNQAHNDKNLL